MKGKMNKNRPIYFQLKIYKQDTSMVSLCTKKKSRILYFIRTVQSIEVDKYYLRVTYSSTVDNNERTIKPINEGFYKTKETLRHALECFCE